MKRRIFFTLAVVLVTITLLSPGCFVKSTWSKVFGKDPAVNDTFEPVNETIETNDTVTNDTTAEINQSPEEQPITPELNQIEEAANKLICYDGSEADSKEACLSRILNSSECPSIADFPKLDSVLQKNTLSQNRDIGNGYYLRIPKAPISFYYPWECDIAGKPGENHKYRYCRDIKITKKIFDDQMNFIVMKEWPATLAIELIDNESRSGLNPGVKAVELICDN